MSSSKFPCCLEEVKDGLKKRLSGLGPDFILEFPDQKSEFTSIEIAIGGKSANHGRLYVYFMVIEYCQKSFLSIVLHFVDIRHGLHECKKEFSVVRRRHVVLGVIDEFPKSGMEKTQRQCRGASIGPITWYAPILVLSVKKLLRIPTSRRSFDLALAAEFLPGLT
jgi:hypothetical protein